MFQRATKTQLKGRLALDGPTGAGKTWTALEWASVMGKRSALIDTERGSASLYSDRFDFDTLMMTPPFEPERLVDALRAAEAEGYDVVIVDSLSHFWEGEGGVLDIVDKAGSRSGGNQFAGWKVGTPALRHLVDTMLALDAHLIVTMRSKMEYVLEEDSRGKKVPRKVGMSPVMRSGMEYEFTLIGDLDLDHRLTISKSRCEPLADAIVQPGRAVEAAETFLRWLEAGEPVASRNEVDALVRRMNSLPDDRRGACKASFVEQFGRPDHLLASQVTAADTFVAGYEASAPPAAPAADGREAATRTEEEPPSGRSEVVTSGGGAAYNGPPPSAALTVKQRSGVMAHLGGMEREARLARLSAIVGREVASTNDLSAAEASAVLDVLGAGG